MKFFIFLVSLALALLAAASPTRKDDGVQFQADIAPKWRRGVAYNNPAYVKSFMTGQNSRVSWAYNWASTTSDISTWYEYVPMLHSDRPDHTGPWLANVDKWVHMGPGTTHVLSFNEPDVCGNGGSCMTDVGRAVGAHRQWVDPLRKYGDKIRIGSPAVSNGGGNNAGLGWLKRFLDACSDCQIDFINIHWYDQAWNTQYFKNHVEEAHRIGGGRPVWITEFRPLGTDIEIEGFLREILPWLDSQDYVYRYAYFWAEKGSPFLINDGGNGLSAIGQVYNSN